MFWTGVAITLFFIVLAVFASLLSRYKFTEYASGGHRFPQLGHPSAAHWMGTTVQSSDVMSRVIYGAQTELKVVVIALAMSLTVGVPLGLISGYFGGILDRALVLLMDALFAFPYLLIAIVIAFVLSTSSIGGGILTAAIAITAAYVPLYFRVVRNHVISVREEPYVDAARALGARPRTVIRKYVFFNVVQNVPPIATLNAADAILLLASLGFLGYGIQPSQGAEWGYDVSRAVSDAASGIWWTGLFSTSERRPDPAGARPPRLLRDAGQARARGRRRHARHRRERGRRARRRVGLRQVDARPGHPRPPPRRRARQW
jgi:peptide/nickel transport system permease protein